MRMKSFRSVAKMNSDQLSNANSAGTVNVYRKTFFILLLSILLSGAF
jgi:hypothetical protein